MLTYLFFQRLIIYQYGSGVRLMEHKLEYTIKECNNILTLQPCDVRHFTRNMGILFFRNCFVHGLEGCKIVTSSMLQRKWVVS